MRCAIAILLLGACAGGDNDVRTATQFLDKLGHKDCDQAFTCKTSFPTDWGITFDEAFGATASECYAGWLDGWDPAQVEKQINAGTIKWNVADANDCIAGMTFGTCTEYWQDGPQMPDSCSTALYGTIADGQACVVDLECASDTSFCDETSRVCTPDTAPRTAKGVTSWRDVVARSL